MGITRLPNGLGFVKPNVHAAQTGGFYFPEGDVTPDVSQGSYFVAGVSALTITYFDSGQQGQIIYVHAQSGGVCTIQNSAGGIKIRNIVYDESAGLVTVDTNTGNALLTDGEIAPFVKTKDEWVYASGSRVIDTGIV